MFLTYKQTVLHQWNPAGAPGKIPFLIASKEGLDFFFYQFLKVKKIFVAASIS